MQKSLRAPVLGVLLAIAITTAMDATGLSDYSELPLLPLLVLFWILQRFPYRSIGLVMPRWWHIPLAMMQPLIVLGVLVLICVLFGVVDAGHTDWHKAASDFWMTAAFSLPIAILTEEGYFRGWLWAALQRAGLSVPQLVIVSAIAFSLWHIPAVSLHTASALPAAQVPILLINAVVIGVSWGILRAITGSVLMTALCHSLWNAAAYTFFGDGPVIGALGIQQTALYGPEAGLLGLAVNLLFATLLWRWWYGRRTAWQ